MDGYLQLVTGPAAPLLTLADARAHLRVEDNTEDDLIETYVSAVTDMLDARYGELGIALVTQTWKQVLSEFPSSGQIILRLPPVQSVTSVTYFDADNAEQTFSTDNYTLTIKDDHACVDLVSGASWPQTYDRADAVSVTYVTGFGDDGTDVPEGIRMAARMMLSHWFDQRSAVTDRPMSELPLAVRSILMKYRVVRGHI
jgi:uncharacterized phiE125 gp8 family phage protein